MADFIWQEYLDSQAHPDAAQPRASILEHIHEHLPMDVHRIGSELVDLRGLDYEEEQAALMGAVERAVARGEFAAGMLVCGRPISGVEMAAFWDWRRNGQASVIDRFIIRLFHWIGIEYEHE